MPRTVEDGFSTLLERLALTDEQRRTANTRRQGLQDWFSKTLTMAHTPMLIGSYQRGTLIRWERDIDLLAPLAFDPYWAQYKDDSGKFLYWVRDQLNAGYGATTVSSRRVAVKMDFSVITADVVPGFYRKGGGFLIPNGSGGWRATNPLYHSTLMAEADIAHGGRLKPLVKLTKAWNVANNDHLSSLHVELLVESIWRGKTIVAYPHAMKETIRVLPAWLRKEFNDPWPNGTRIDSYLSDNERERVIRMLTEDAKASAAAEEHRKDRKVERAFERWNAVYRQFFPAFG